MKETRVKKRVHVENNERMTIDEIDVQLQQIESVKSKRRIVTKAMNVLIVVSAISILLAVRCFPVMQITGNSMEPTLEAGDIIIASRYSNYFERGDLIAFYYNDSLLIKRVIGLPGDEISMDISGNVYVNGQVLDEPYVLEKTLGIDEDNFCTTVADGAFFVLGDNRYVALDSRAAEMRSIHSERVIGKVWFSVLPMKKL